MQLRDLLPTILATFTGPRHEVKAGRDFQWDNTNSRVWQAFRAYEVAFGRRTGIRWEGSLDDGKWISGTWENTFVAFEGALRGLLRGLIPKFKIVKVPQLVAPNGMVFNSPYRYAIAFDAAPANSAATGSTAYACTITGSNMYLFAADAYSTTGSDITGTFNGVGMSATTGYIWIGVTNPQNALYLAGPATGTNNLVPSSNCQGMVASSYSGCDQGAIDADAHNVTTSSTDVTVTINTATANCWAVFFVTGTNSIITGGTGTTVRSNTIGVGGGAPSVLDSNANVATGSVTYHATASTGAGQTFGMIGIKFKEFAAAGPANVKSWDGVTQSTGIKTYFGVALGSTKTVDGIN